MIRFTWVTSKLVSKTKRYRREVKMKIKFTWVSRDMEALPVID